MLKVTNKDTRTTPWTYLTPCSSVSIVIFEQVNPGWILAHFDGGRRPTFPKLQKEAKNNYIINGEKTLSDFINTY